MIVSVVLVLIIPEAALNLPRIQGLLILRVRRVRLPGKEAPREQEPGKGQQKEEGMSEKERKRERMRTLSDTVWLLFRALRDQLYATSTATDPTGLSKTIPSHGLFDSGSCRRTE